MFTRFAAVAAIIIASLYVCPPVTLAQHTADSSSGLVIDKFEVDFGSKRIEQFIGDDSRGWYWAHRFDCNASSHHQTLFSLSFSSIDLHAVNLRGTEQNARTLSIGTALPVRRGLTIRTVYNSLVEYQQREAIEAGGLYLDVRPARNWKFEFGSEMFLDQSVDIIYGVGTYTFPNSCIRQVAIGASQYRMPPEAGDRSFDERLVCGGIFSIPFKKLLVGLGTDPMSWDTAQSAWTGMIALPAPLEANWWEPSAYFNWRQKPGSRYFLAMGAIGGSAFNQYVIDALMFSAWRSPLYRTRNVRNQNFYLQILNQHSQEFGRFSWSYVWSEFTLTSALRSRNSEAALYYSAVGWSSGGLAQPFIGYTYSSEEQVVFDYDSYQLKSPRHRYHSIEAGVRVRTQNRGSGIERGYVRLSCTALIGSSGLEGAKVYLSTWL